MARQARIPKPKIRAHPKRAKKSGKRASGATVRLRKKV